MISALGPAIPKTATDDKAWCDWSKKSNAHLECIPESGWHLRYPENRILTPSLEESAPVAKLLSPPARAVNVNTCNYACACARARIIAFRPMNIALTSSQN